MSKDKVYRCSKCGQIYRPHPMDLESGMYMCLACARAFGYSGLRISPYHPR